MSYLTDSEKQLLFSALHREKEVCQKIDDTKVEDATCKMLVPIVKSLERKFYYDRFEKEIREMVIDEFCEKLSERLTEISDNTTIYGVKNVDFLTLDTVIDEIGDIAEEVKRGTKERDTD